MKVCQSIDEFALRTRVIPAVLVLFPYLYVIHSSEMSLAALINSLLINVIIVIIVSNLSTELSRKKLEKFHSMWGGKPATILLRHSDKTLPPSAKRQYHQLLGSYFGQKLPSEGFETANPAETDELYDACIEWLIKNTSDKNTFPTLFQERASYGFWNAMYALKKCGIAVSILALLIMLGAYILAQAGLYRLDVRMLLTPVVSALALWGWFKHVNVLAVQHAAYRYAKALLATCDQLQDQRRLI